VGGVTGLDGGEDVLDAGLRLEVVDVVGEFAQGRLGGGFTRV
jgi:hypothetical protein